MFYPEGVFTTYLILKNQTHLQVLKTPESLGLSS